MALATHIKLSVAALACAVALACAAAAPADAAITAAVANGTLTVTGDSAADSVQLKLATGAPGTLQVVFFGQVHSSHDRSRFTRIVLRGGKGGDRLIVDDKSGAFTHQEQTTIEGGDDSDDLGGGAGGEVIDGGSGDDSIDGEGFGSTTGIPDTVDVLRGGAGDDRFDWSPDQGRELIDGGPDQDSVRAITSRDDEALSLGLSESLLVVTRTSTGSAEPGETAFAIDPSTEKLDLETRNGNDTIEVRSNLPSTIALELDGGRGTDTITGGEAGETITGGEDADVLRGAGGDDSIAGNEGDDELHGDAGTDSLDGGAGIDRFSCGGFGDRLVFEQGVDVVGEDCLDPAAQPQPAPQPQPEPQPQPVAPAPVAPVAAFAKPKVRGTLKALTVSVRNSGAVALELRVGATERAGGRSFRYAKRTVRVAPGATAKVVLRTPAALRRLLARAAARRAVVRRPTITVADRAAGAGTATLRARVALKRVR
ncbi:MAG TPA: calcium-binding protein [Thermoleophilaceae bacterium]